MATQPRQQKPAPSEGNAPQRAQPKPRSVGRSGHGAESALRHLKTWEQRRASDSAQGSRDKPSPA